MSDCGLSQLPEALRKCSHLKSLNLRHNNLATVPTALFDMPSVQQVDLTGNRLPVAVVRALNENPQPFLQELRKGRPMKSGEMKLMIVGQENVGKTTLLRWLRREHDAMVSMNTITTDGIDISSIALAGGKAAGGVTFRAWDFAGQEVYYLTHQFFLSENGIYVLLWDLRYPPDSSRLEWWLQSIASRAHSAPVILLGTRAILFAFYSFRLFCFPSSSPFPLLTLSFPSSHLPIFSPSLPHLPIFSPSLPHLPIFPPSLPHLPIFSPS